MADRRNHDLTDVYDRLAPAVLGYFRSHRMADPEGLTGDVFVSVAEKLSGFDGNDAALRRWVFTIAHHRRVDAIRRAQRRPDHPSADERILDAPTSDEVPLLDVELLDALDGLTPDQREIVVLRFVADLPIKAVAKLTGRSSGSVKMLQQRALDALEAALHPAAEDFSNRP